MTSIFLSPVASNNKRKRDFSQDAFCFSDRTTADIQPGRTMKRWRNGRPSDEMVHQYTLQKLFSAQSTTHSVVAPAASAAVSAPSFLAALQSKSPPQTSQRGNPFATMSHTKPSATTSGFLKLTPLPTPPATTDILLCEDCDGRIQLSGFGEIEHEGRCRGCSKSVCENGCSITNGDGGRVCLECAMKM